MCFTILLFIILKTIINVNTKRFFFSKKIENEFFNQILYIKFIFECFMFFFSNISMINSNVFVVNALNVFEQKTTKFHDIFLQIFLTFFTILFDLFSTKFIIFICVRNFVKKI